MTDLTLLIALIVISSLQLLYIFIQHFFYNKQIQNLHDTLKAIDHQLEYKMDVITDLKNALTLFEEELQDKNIVIHELREFLKEKNT